MPACYYTWTLTVLHRHCLPLHCILHPHSLPLQQITVVHLQTRVALLGYLKGNTEAGEPLVRGLVMEMMDMGSLQEVIGGLLIPLESTVAIMLQAAVGLLSLHDKSLIHMDVKAANYGPYLVRAS
ncbi:hypothetical protein CEUSTIGMA_g3641.t1 [Chlamydomonas eustigma]|uniref:Protein kinase domain-containing protein n=1 Tax=Chlamydomonas eustigma TaxID=1157962 RepID=A0A250WZD2_9CHLO|nr:hypothetical protein CEUSTIGMA_g3641.t1 [Chlamydomonas eustigma]|eukprot:GAX76197.1 hypothetical protein CEUSTIGMA_g3641.t1 [Chlamydomonas eustigma]